MSPSSRSLQLPRVVRVDISPRPLSLDLGWQYAASYDLQSAFVEPICIRFLTVLCHPWGPPVLCATEHVFTSPYQYSLCASNLVSRLNAQIKHALPLLSTLSLFPR